MFTCPWNEFGLCRLTVPLPLRTMPVESAMPAVPLALLSVYVTALLLKVTELG